MSDETPIIIDPAEADPEARRLAEQGLGWEGGEVVPSQCVLCRYKARNPDAAVPYCRAFPGGIPAEFLLNEADHRAFVDHDGGVRFEPAADADPAALGRLFAALDLLRDDP